MAYKSLLKVSVTSPQLSLSQAEQFLLQWHTDSLELHHPVSSNSFVLVMSLLFWIQRINVWFWSQVCLQYPSFTLMIYTQHESEKMLISLFL